MNEHSDKTLSIDDPRLTAYALGELRGADLAEVEAAVRADPRLQEAVRELRELSGRLAKALAREAADVPAQSIILPRKKRGLGSLVPFQWAALATLAAACFAVVVGIQHIGQETATPAAMNKEQPVEPQPISELEHRLQVARGAGGTAVTMPAMRKPLYASVETKLSAVQLPPMPPLPSAGAGGFGGFGGMVGLDAPRPTATLGAGTGMGAGASGHMTLSFLGMTSAGPAESYANAESYSHPGDNSYINVADQPLSTFSIDVDTASYANVRRFLTQGKLPPLAAVRVEELVNYFPYDYAPPVGDVPFAAKLEVASAPWAPEHRLVRIGIKGREVATQSRPAANLVFLLDVSGSMRPANKLPLVKESLRMLVGRLRPDDRVAIVVYAGASGLALPSTPVANKVEILDTLERLNSGGSTNGAMGIHLAYDVAKANFVKGGVNRVILCTDGDFNVGVTGRDELVRLIEDKARGNVFLSVFGFGMGNIKDATLEALSDKGNGTYGYIDTLREAQKVFIEQAEGTLVTIAKDVKIQVEFNPAAVSAYRLVGYENRLLKKEDFNNDAVDAGDIGAGHTVTALYEIVPVGAAASNGRPLVDPLKYQTPSARPAAKPVSTGAADELLTVKIRYKQPAGDVSSKLEFPLRDAGRTFAQADGEFRFAAAVAAWGMLLRDSPAKGTATFADVMAWAEDGLGHDENGYRSEFLQLVRRSDSLSTSGRR